MGEERGREEGPFRLTTREETRWTRLVPWIVVVPLVAVIVYLLSSGPITATRVVPAIGVGLTALVACSGAIASLTPGAKAWSRRTATVTRDGITVMRPGRDPLALPFSSIGRLHTHPEVMGLRIPPAVQLVTDFYGVDRRRIPELTVHHAAYRYAVRSTDANPDGPALLHELEQAPVRLDAQSLALVEATYRTDAGGPDQVSARAVEEARAGRMWHALRAAERDALRSDRTSALLVRLCLVLGHEAVDTARAGVDQHPGESMFRHYLAHALLDEVGVSENPGPAALAHREELRAEARGLFESLVADAAFGADAALELRALPAHDDGAEG